MIMKKQTNSTNEKVNEMNSELNLCKMCKFVTGVATVLTAGIIVASLGILTASGIEASPNAGAGEKLIQCLATAVATATTAFGIRNIPKYKLFFDEIKDYETELHEEKKIELNKMNKEDERAI